MLYVLFSLTNAFAVFVSSFTTAYFICRVYQVPFYNIKTIQQNVDAVYENIIPVGISSFAIGYFTLHFVAFANHTWIMTGANIFAYTIIVELLYYLYHKQNYLRHIAANTVSDEPEKTYIYPVQILNMDFLDITSYIACLHIPLAIIHMNYFEYIICAYFYVTMGYFSKSDFLYHQVIDNNSSKYKFCLVFPLFDSVFRQNK